MCSPWHQAESTFIPSETNLFSQVSYLACFPEHSPAFKPGQVFFQLIFPSLTVFFVVLQFICCSLYNTYTLISFRPLHVLTLALGHPHGRKNLHSYQVKRTDFPKFMGLTEIISIQRHLQVFTWNPDAHGFQFCVAFFPNLTPGLACYGTDFYSSFLPYGLRTYTMLTLEKKT